MEISIILILEILLVFSPKLYSWLTLVAPFEFYFYILYSTSPNKTRHTPTHPGLILFPFWSPSFLTPALGFCSLCQIFYIWYLQCQNYKKFNSKCSGRRTDLIRNLESTPFNSCMMWTLLISVGLKPSEEWSYISFEGSSEVWCKVCAQRLVYNRHLGSNWIINSL